MSFRCGDLVIIAAEPDGCCEACGNRAELRPYGPRGERICFDCGMKDEPMTRKQRDVLLYGDKADS